MKINLVEKSVYITEEQSDWLEKNPINFSKFVRLQLNIAMSEK